MPDPEILPDEAATVARRLRHTGRPDVPNQINSGLASPGIWRGALDCRATEINVAMTLAAANAIAETAAQETGPSEFNVVPSIFNQRLVPNGRGRAGGRREHRGRPAERARRRPLVTPFGPAAKGPPRPSGPAANAHPEGALRGWRRGGPFPRPALSEGA